MGFLWFNVHPAQIFMGDLGRPVARGDAGGRLRSSPARSCVLPLIGIIFVIETGSVVLQVAYFKATGGKRIFRMTPIHHHFELGGWDEEKITLRFWIIGDPGRPPRRDVLPRLDQGPARERAARTMAMMATTERPIDLDRLTLADVRGRRPARPAGHRPRAWPGAASRSSGSSATRGRA